MQIGNSNIKWILDPSQSEITFKVRHHLVSSVKGKFKNFAIEIDGEDITSSKVLVKIDSASISTNDVLRDAYLMSADFLDVGNYKEIIFDGSFVKRLDDFNFKIKGRLSIKGMNNEVSLAVNYGGHTKTALANECVGFIVNGKINRNDWRLRSHTVIDTGEVMMGEEVEIQATLQFIRN